jgi:hypothetical protein
MTDKNNSPAEKTTRPSRSASGSGLVSDEDTRETGQKERRTAGPDGGDSREIGNTFKKSPGGRV